MEELDLHREKSYMIEGISVLDFTKLGDSVTSSRLTSVGTLKDLRVEGSLNIDECVHYDANTERLGIGTPEPNGQLAIKSLDHEFVIDPTEDSEFIEKAIDYRRCRICLPSRRGMAGEVPETSG